MTEPFDTTNQEERVRAALGIAYGPLPEVRSHWLQRYYEHLSVHLVLPFDAEYAEEIAGYQQLITPVTVIAILHPSTHDKHEERGLLCRARRGGQELDVPLADVELRESAPNSQLIDDYWYWFWNWRFDPQI